MYQREDLPQKLRSALLFEIHLFLGQIGTFYLVLCNQIKPGSLSRGKRNLKLNEHISVLPWTWKINMYFTESKFLLRTISALLSPQPILRHEETLLAYGKPMGEYTRPPPLSKIHSTKSVFLMCRLLGSFSFVCIVILFSSQVYTNKIWLVPSATRSVSSHFLQSTGVFHSSTGPMSL